MREITSNRLSPSRVTLGKKLLATAIGASTVPLVTAPAWALDESARTLEEIVVTAQRREENLNDVPIAVVAINEDALQRVGVQGTGSIPEVVPSVQLVRSGPSAMFFVRGVGNTSGGTGQEGANAIYVDGVFLSDLKQSVFKFNNIERIEVLKGPQGTLFGRNASGGLINVITREPGQETVGKIKLGVGNYNSQTLNAYFASPLTDTLSADVAISSTNQSDGWGKDEVTGREIGKGWDWGVRSKWVWTPSDELKVTFTGDYNKQSDNYAMAFRLDPESVGLSPVSGAFTAPNDPYDTETPDEQYSDIETQGFSVTAEYDLGWSTLTSITAYRDSETHSSLDPDTGPDPVYHIDIHSTTDSLQQELRLSSNDTDPLSWQTGIFLLRSESQLKPQESYGVALTRVGGGTLVNSTMTTWSSSVFGEVTYAFSDVTRLIAGVRYTKDKQLLTGEQSFYNTLIPTLQVRDSQTAEEATYRLALHQDLTDTISVYGSYNRGFKSGTYSMSNLTLAPVTPQTTDAFEVGLKSTLMEDRLRLNLAAFHYNIQDYQVRAATGAAARPELLNAAEVEIDGFEVEFEALATERLRLYGAFTWLDSKFNDFPLAPYTTPNLSTVGGNTETLAAADGNHTPLAPDFAGNVGVSYNIPMGAGELDWNLLYSYNSGYYFEPDNRLEQPSFDTVNGSIVYQSGDNWSVELWGRNLTDETYYVQKLSSALTDIAVPAAPRTFGVSVGFEF